MEQKISDREAKSKQTVLLWRTAATETRLDYSS